MSTSHFPKVSLPEKMAEWRAASPAQREIIMLENLFKLNNAIADLYESKKRHHERIRIIEDGTGRTLAIGHMRNPEDSASFVVTEMELDKAKKALEKYESNDVWIKRLVIGGIVSVITSIAIAAIILLVKVIAKAALQ